MLTLCAKQFDKVCRKMKNYCIVISIEMPNKGEGYGPKMFKTRGEMAISILLG